VTFPLTSPVSFGWFYHYVPLLFFLRAGRRGRSGFPLYVPFVPSRSRSVFLATAPVEVFFGFFFILLLGEVLSRGGPQLVPQAHDFSSKARRCST